MGKKSDGDGPDQFQYSLYGVEWVMTEKLWSENHFEGSDLAYSKYYPNICLQELSKTTINFSQYLRLEALTAKKCV
jgi:hypothetical protein